MINEKSADLFTMPRSGNCSFLEEPDYPRNLGIQVAGKSSLESCKGYMHSASFTSYELYDEGTRGKSPGLHSLVCQGIGEIRRRPHEGMGGPI